MKQIARELGVRYVIEGSVRRAAVILVSLVMGCRLGPWQRKLGAKSRSAAKCHMRSSRFSKMEFLIH